MKKVPQFRSKIDYDAIKERPKKHSQMLTHFFTKAKEEKMQIDPTEIGQENIISMDDIGLFCHEYNDENLELSSDEMKQMIVFQKKRRLYVEQILPLFENKLNSDLF